ncbi:MULTISPECIES: transcriptional regulator [unclassified Planococcus (in: firmicutes)]|uniref:transcriptional regulator n=1 Tax=Planococcus TaxID=1372 RepID=UPI000C330BAB|nr:MULTISPECIES: transcriptional regulator [unclassified Planococcus (in: firmicutes)]AUD12815.1 transcriptional regulator [Planococcus sp. MB-3u-03]PKG47434.1 transcriptional regulator [Planococcus sp. Urea-trap-24]PKG88242.1 transcriptional regulator [Planococcus sp. Urea-3u-39]PKH36833.1 transcriptional regulator [Planococcus sp. MB-3u-09]
MKAQLLKAFKYRQLIDIMYMANDGTISKRRVKILKVSGDSFQAYCFLRREKRHFKISHVLSCMPVRTRERQIV